MGRLGEGVSALGQEYDDMLSFLRLLIRHACCVYGKGLLSDLGGIPSEPPAHPISFVHYSDFQALSMGKEMECELLIFPSPPFAISLPTLSHC